MFTRFTPAFQILTLLSTLLVTPTIALGQGYPPGGLYDGLVGYWSFDEGSGTIAHDSSATANDGTIHGATWVSGVSGTALDFDGTNDYVVADAVIVDYVTVSVWARWDTFYHDNSGHAVVSNSYGAQNGFMLYHHTWTPWNQLKALVHTGGGPHTGLVAPPELATEQWYHLVLTYDGTMMRLYIDGAVVAEVEEYGTITPSTALLYFGLSYRPNYGSYFNGALDEIYIYGRALSSNEILYLYEHPGNHSPLCSVDLTYMREDFCEPTPESFVVTAGEPILVPFTGEDSDGDDLTATLYGLPGSATLSPLAGATPLVSDLEWTPEATDKGGAPYTVEVAFEDPHGEVCVSSFVIEDINLPPECDAGSDIEEEADSPAGKEITLVGSASDPDDAPANLTYHWDVPGVELDDPSSPTPTGIFPIKVTQATLTVTDGRGGVDVDSVSITVQDSIPPEVICTTNIGALWPPKHDMREVTVIVEATDICSNPEFIFPLEVSVRSDEEDDAIGQGDGSTTGDVNGSDGYTAPVDILGELEWDADNYRYIGTILMRAERDGAGDGRRYTIDVTAWDSQGNWSTTSCCVVVPHDRRGGGGS